MLRANFLGDSIINLLGGFLNRFHHGSRFELSLENLFSFGEDKISGTTRSFINHKTFDESLELLLLLGRFGKVFFLVSSRTVCGSSRLSLAVEVLDLRCRFSLVSIRFLLGFNHLTLLLGQFNIGDFSHLTVLLLFFDSVILGDWLGRTRAGSLGLIDLLAVTGPFVEVNLHVIKDSHRFNDGFCTTTNRCVLAFIDGFLGNPFDFLHDFYILVYRVSHVKSFWTFFLC